MITVITTTPASIKKCINEKSTPTMLAPWLHYMLNNNIEKYYQLY